MNYLGIDVGGTTTTGIRLENGIIRESIIIPTAKKNKKECVQTIISCIQHLINKNVQGIGIGIPGHYDLSSEKIITTPNLPLSNTKLREVIQQLFSLPIHIDNDANCFALAHARDKQKELMVGITLGTGVGCGIIIDGTVYRGQNFAGEISRLPQPSCSATQKYKHTLYKDTLGISGVLDMAKKHNLSVHSPKDLQKLGRTTKDQKTQYIVHEIYTTYGETLGNLLVTVNQFSNPQHIVIGGGLAKSWNLFSPSMKKTLKELSTITLPKITMCKDPLMGAKGAAYLCIN